MVSALDKARMMGTSFFTGRVIRPGEETAALIRQQMRGQRDGIPFGFDEHVLQDRHRRPVPDDVGDAREAVEKVVPVDLELHDGVRIEQPRGERQPCNAHTGWPLYLSNLHL